MNPQGLRKPLGVKHHCGSLIWLSANSGPATATHQSCDDLKRTGDNVDHDVLLYWLNVKNFPKSLFPIRIVVTIINWNSGGEHERNVRISDERKK